MMDKTFEPAAVEARIAARWEEAGAFRAGRPDRAAAEPYAIVIPPPNVTGSLHMGHALNNTLQDVLCRFERMRGKDVLWQPGTDHAGIATQMVVERRLAAENRTDRRSMGREAFLAEVWKQKEESESVILGQLRRLGASCDWSRSRFTMDEGLSRAVVKVFVQLHRDGLIYRDKRLVNWDPRFQTAISDLEVQQIEVKGQLWHIRYPIEGEAGRFITVATTRPETMLGDTGVAVHPDDERFRDLVGKHAILPLVGRRIPIVADEYSDPEKGTGAVKITPAHDFNDFEVGKRHGLSAVNIMSPEARLQLAGNDAFLEGLDRGPDLDAVLRLDDLDRFEARKRIVAMLEEHGFLEKVEPHVHMVPHGDRSGVPVEPYLTDQWYVDVKPLAERAVAAVRAGETRFVPENWEKTYFQWLENIEPWCVSRQLWWGHQIPAWYAPDGSVYVAESEDEALAEALAQAVVKNEMTDDEARALASDPERAAGYLARDEDVLDTWFSSGLWPFSTLGWPDETPELKRYYPTSVARHRLRHHLLLGRPDDDARPALHGRGAVPRRLHPRPGARRARRQDVEVEGQHHRPARAHRPLRRRCAALHARRAGGAGARHQALDPARRGQPQLRDQDMERGALRRDEFLRACARVRSARRRRDAQPLDPRRDGKSGRRGHARHRALQVQRGGGRGLPLRLERLLRLVPRARKAGAAGRRRRGEERDAGERRLRARPDLQAAAPVHAVPHRGAVGVDFLPPCGGGGPAEGRVGGGARRFRAGRRDARRTAHQVDRPPPLTPPRKGEGNPTVLALAPWPALEGLIDEAAEAELGWVVELISEIRSARSETNVPAGAQIPLLLVNPSAAARARAARWDETIRRLARLSTITIAESAPRSSVQLIVRGEVAALPLEGVVDLEAEVARLDKERAKLAGDIDKIDVKLANADFLARAPEEIVDEQRERRDAAQARRRKIEEALARLSAGMIEPA